MNSDKKKFKTAVTESISQQLEMRNSK